jgi:hypothetical protein
VAYYPDLTFYSYAGRNTPGVKNVGWLKRDRAFATEAPSEETLDLLWSFCSAPVIKMRGFHACDLCDTAGIVAAERHGVRQMLAHAEIRVFSAESSTANLQRALGQVESGGLILVQRSLVPFQIYAAPALIYHYVEAHHYRPPDEFLRALREGPKPSDLEYAEFLTKSGGVELATSV